MARTKEEWQDWVMTRWFAQKPRDGHDELSIMSLGLGGEAGEVQEYIKKYIRDGVHPCGVSKRNGFIWELGDVLHYLTRIAGEFGITLDEIIEGNIDKLDRRDRGEKVG